MKKLLLVIAALSLVLAGCQKQEDTDATTPATDATTPATDASTTPAAGDAATTTP